MNVKCSVSIAYRFDAIYIEGESREKFARTSRIVLRVVFPRLPLSSAKWEQKVPDVLARCCVTPPYK